MLQWWNELGTVAQIFYCMAIPATLVLVIQTVLLFLGLDGEDGSDAGEGLDIEAEADGEDLLGMDEDALSGIDGLRIFTIRGIVAFFVVFGWLGIVLDGASAPLWATITFSALAGIAMMVFLAWLFRAVMKLRSDGNTDNRNAIGTSGKVHLTIPASRSGEGKVHLMLQGAFVEREAVTDEDQPIPTGSEVVVIGLSGQTDLVVKRK
jgi:membrane protein implicated in regulation of membrane protease activity